MTPLLNGGSFLALREKPGAGPGPGWQLLAAPGKRGIAGKKGRRAIEVLLALPARREKTPRRWWAGTSTAQPTALPRS